MSQVRSLWAVIMLSVEESLTAFSGVSPETYGVLPPQREIRLFQGS